MAGPRARAAQQSRPAQSHGRPVSEAINNESARCWTPRLLAVDADGTIADENGIVPAELRTALRRIDASGIPVVVDTGRAWLSAKLILDQLQLEHAYCVCNNGATVVTYPPMCIIRSWTFDPAGIIRALRDHPSIIICTEVFGRGYAISRPLSESLLYELHGDHEIVSLDDMASEPVSRIILHDPLADEVGFDAMLATLDLAPFSHAKSGANWLDIASGETNKARGLAVVAHELGIDQADVLALGDSYNDIDLLAWAGRGVALGGAPPELVDVAAHVTSGFHQGGTLEELTRWFGV